MLQSYRFELLLTTTKLVSKFPCELAQLVHCVLFRLQTGESKSERASVCM